MDSQRKPHITCRTSPSWLGEEDRFCERDGGRNRPSYLRGRRDGDFLFARVKALLPYSRGVTHSLYLLAQASGRPYFKNHETRQTTWVDPRSAAVRKQVHTLRYLRHGRKHWIWLDCLWNSIGRGHMLSSRHAHPHTNNEVWRFLGCPRNRRRRAAIRLG